MHRDNDFFPYEHSHLGSLYGATDLAARLTYEERLRHASEMHRVFALAEPRRPRVSLVARVGTTLVHWGERLQAAGAAVPAASSVHSL